MSDTQHPCKGPVPFTWPNIHTAARSAAGSATLAEAFLSPDITKDLITFQDDDGNIDYINSWEKVAMLTRAIQKFVRELEQSQDN